MVGYYVGAFVNVSSRILPSAEIGQTMAFLICGWTSVLHIFNVRSKKSIFKTTILKALVISAMGMLVLFDLLTLSPIGQLFGLATISGIHWFISIGLALIPMIIRELGVLADKNPQVWEECHLSHEYK